MPEPNKAGAGAPTDPKASTPSTTDKPPTHKSDTLMTALQIPEDMQQRIMAADHATEATPPPAGQLPPEITPDGEPVQPEPPAAGEPPAATDQIPPTPEPEA